MKTVFAALLFIILIPTVSFAQRESFPGMLRLAKRGEAWAQNEVGLMYSLGEGVRRDRRKAVYWLKKSANQGFPLGACSLGLHYGFGWGVKRNYVLMLKWVFIGETLDGLRCSSESIKDRKPSECQVEKGWELALAWLKAHPELKNEFGQQPWLKESESNNQELKKKCSERSR